ncbi:NnrS family protein [Paenirhodobacter sp.]|uniref:NnrS family protein n=1 Tax=Paenirhodobacter sp. TaxID=1965326 RepID=UPI003B3F1207
MTPSEPRPAGGIPRGLARTGPVLFSYGFRPFFLGGGIWAVMAMALWVAFLSGFGTPGGAYGALPWHMHEMLFGFGSAVLSGFLMTAVPNWTGRMPLSGPPLLALAGLWLAGRVAFTWPVMGLWPGVVLEALFLPVMAVVFLTEIVAGRKWRDLKVVGAVAVLAAANLGFHAAVLWQGDPRLAARLAVAAYIVLILIIGGRITPSFTRNWLNRQGKTPLPVPFGRYDAVTVGVSAGVLALWVLWPESRVTGVGALLAGGMNLVRLARWRGWQTWAEPLVLALHGGYLMLCLGFLAVGLGLSEAGALHVFAVGAIGGEMLAVMTRATRGHTGRALAASGLTVLSYLALVAAALLRPAAEIGAYGPLVAASGAAWMLAFGLFLWEHAPWLLTKRRDLRGG